MVVTLPETLDADALVTLAERLERSPAPRRLVGEACFCRGLRLEGDHEADLSVEAFVRVVRALRTGPVVVAYVDGDARGAGVGLAAACDLVVASPRASFGLSELWFGLWPAAIHPLLAERMRPTAVRWLALTGKTIDATEAQALGLVDRLGDEADAVRGLEEARRAEPEAVVRYKTMTAPLEAVAAGASATAQRLGHPEVRRRLRAFAEGYAPWG